MLLELCHGHRRAMDWSESQVSWTGFVMFRGCLELFKKSNPSCAYIYIYILYHIDKYVNPYNQFFKSEKKNNSCTSSPSKLFLGFCGVTGPGRLTKNRGLGLVRHDLKHAGCEPKCIQDR